MSKNGRCPVPRGTEMPAPLNRPGIYFFLFTSRKIQQVTTTISITKRKASNGLRLLPIMKNPVVMPIRGKMIPGKAENLRSRKSRMPVVTYNIPKASMISDRGSCGSLKNISRCRTPARSSSRAAVYRTVLISPVSFFSTQSANLP